MPATSSRLSTAVASPGVSKSFAFASPYASMEAVVVEVIVRKVGEERAVEGHAVDTALDEAVRGHFHRDRLRSLHKELLHQAVDLECVRRGVQRFTKRIGKIQRRGCRSRRFSRRGRRARPRSIGCTRSCRWFR
jgi:hypothetical protein